MKEYFTIPREDLGKIHKIACPLWKERIETLMGGADLFKSTLDVHISLIRDMLSAATSSQKGIVEEVFKEYVTMKRDLNPFPVSKGSRDTNILVRDFSKKLFDREDVIQMSVCSATTIRRPDLYNRAFYISSEYQVILHPDPSTDGTVVELTKR